VTSEVFISYSSRDRERLENLLSALRRADERIWFDDELGGGDVWWQKILERIRDCEVFVFALSDESLESKPCLTELRYAQALQKPILPVQIGPVESMRISPLAAVEAIDFQNPTVDSGIRLVTAVQRARQRCAALPSPLPEEPPVPYAYLMRLAGTVTGAALNAQQQNEVLTELGAALAQDRDDTTARRDITQLLRALYDRTDATTQTRTEAQRLLATLGSSPSPEEPADPVGLKTNRGSRRRVIAAVGAVAVVAAAGLAILSTRQHSQPIATTGSPGASVTAAPAVAPENLSSFLLSPAEVSAVTGFPAMQGDPPDDAMFDPPGQISDPNCLGSDYAAAQPVYEGSGWSAVSVQVLSETSPDDPDNVLFWLNQAAVSFPSERQAQDFLDKSADRWSGCSGQVVKDDIGTDPISWTFGDLIRDETSISQVSFSEGGQGWACQHTLKTYSNSVFEAVTCGKPITDEATSIVDKMLEKAKA
jgi:hypothetical protein